METFALVMLLVFSDSAATTDKAQANILDSGLTFEDCAQRESASRVVHSDEFVTVTALSYCERE